MNKNSSTILSIALAVMVAFLVFSGLFLDRNLEQLKADRELTEHTYRVIETLGQVYSDLLNAEAGERALLIISDETALVRVETAIADVHKHLRALGSLVSDNPTQTENFKELEVLINERFKFTEKLSEHIQSGGGQYSKLISKDYIANARMVMGRLRPHVEKMEEIEAKLLQQRTEAAATTENFVRLILLLGSTISILSLIGVYVLFRRYLAAQAIDIKRKAHEAWLKQNEAEASRLAVTYPTVQQLSEPLLRLLIDASGAVAGNIFLASGKTLEFVAGYGSDEIRKGNIFSKEFKVGEGLVGEAALAQDIVELTNIPDKYFHIRSSLGDSAPARIVFIPLRFQEQLVGLIEVASFGQLKDSARALFRHLAPVFAAGINAAQSRDRQQALLEETQVQAEELQAQQEELRTSNEELEQQTRALAESHARMQSQQEELQQNNEELEQQARAMEEQQEFINARNVELENIRRQLETKAVDLERASVYKSEFLAKMSHELRTPLNSLMILATLLKENKHGNLNNQQIEFATTIHDAGADLLGLINDILDLSKLEARKLSARPEPFDLRSLFDQLAGTFRPLIDQKNLQFKINISQDAPEKLFTDRQRLAQIVTNFLSNAVKFTEQGSIILEASATDKSDQLMITVIDTGVGIPEEKRKLIFEAFEQADSSISRKYGGTGLGLTISRELATLLGGSILVSSETDKGSRFSIVIPTDIRTVQPVQADKKTETAAIAAPTVIPVVEVQSSISPVSTPSGPDTIQDEAYEAQAKKLLSRLSPKDRTILIVEDEANFRTAIADEARAQGFTPIEVNDAETALAVLKKHIPQAVMLDIKLPGLSGLTLLEMIKETPRLRHIPIHMVSALEYQRNALRLGAIGYLGKPVSIEGVRAAVDRLEKALSQDIKHVLIVEDDERQRQAIRELVNGRDIEIVAVGSSRAALEEIDRRPFDCIILDLTLPDMSGFAFLERLNSIDSRSLPPVIVYTGKDLSREELDSLQKYSDSIIIKGAKSPERLLDEVSLFLHRVESSLPAEKRAMLESLRHRDRSFEGRKVLIVDDDLRNVFALTSALEAKGFEVEAARNGVEALDKLNASKKFDVVLMDIMMPKMDGFEAMRRIRKIDRFRTLPVIALTAKTMKGEQERCIEAGASDYLPKPINLMNLLSALKAWLPRPEIEL